MSRDRAGGHLSSVKVRVDGTRDKNGVGEAPSNGHLGQAVEATAMARCVGLFEAIGDLLDLAPYARQLTRAEGLGIVERLPDEMGHPLDPRVPVLVAVPVRLVGKLACPGNQLARTVDACP